MNGAIEGDSHTAFLPESLLTALGFLKATTGRAITRLFSFIGRSAFMGLVGTFDVCALLKFGDATL
jgi:hypothetical protein